MQRIRADYAGGDPDGVNFIGISGTLIEDSGGIRFVSTLAERRGAAGLMASQGNDELEIVRLEPSEVLTVGAGEVNYMRMLTRTAVGESIAGGWGGIIGAATGKRNHGLVVVARRDDFTFTVNFTVAPTDARKFLDTLQRERRNQGLGSLPTIEDALGTDPAVDPAEAHAAQLGVLNDIRLLLEEQNALLRGLAGRDAT
jgi:hypothetical protein